MVSVMALRWELETKGQANGKKKTVRRDEISMVGRSQTIM